MVRRILFVLILAWSTLGGAKIALAEEVLLLDIYFGGKKLGIDIATDNGVTLTISDYERFIEVMPKIKASKLGSVVDQLSKPLAVIDQVNCQSGSCLARDNPDKIMLLVDRVKMRAEILIPKIYFDADTKVDDRYYKGLNRRLFSWIQSESLVFSKDGLQDNYALSSKTSITHKKNELDTTFWLDNSDVGGQLSELYATHRELKWQFQWGVKNSRRALFPIAREITFMGAGISREFNLRKDFKNLNANPVRLYLPRRSTVRLFYQDQLMMIREYETGYQLLPTADLPPGVYDVRLEIDDYSGNIKTEHRAITKSNMLPPSGEVPWLLEVGKVVRSTSERFMPEDAGTTLVRAGAAKKIAEHTGVSAGITLTNENRVVETAINHVMRYGSLSLAAGVGSQGAASKIDLRLNKDGRFLNIKSDINDLSVNNIDQGDSRGKQTFIQLGQALWGGGLSLSYKRDKNRLTTETTTSLEFRKLLSRAGTDQVMGFVKLSKENNDNQFNVGVRYTARSRKSQYALNLAQIDDSPDKAAETEIEFNGNWKSPFESDDVNETTFSAGATQRGGRDRVIVGVNSKKSLGTIEASIVKTRDKESKESSETSFFGRVASTFGVIGDNFFMGGDAAITSGAVVRVAPVKGELSYEVSVDGQVVDSVRGGSSKVVPLSPYDKHNIKLKPQGSVISDGRIVERDLFSLPGTIEMIEVKPIILKPLLATIYDENNKLLRGLYITNAYIPSHTDEEGFLQVEIKSESKKIIGRRGDGTTCTINIPESNTSEEVLFFDRLVCNK